MDILSYTLLLIGFGLIAVASELWNYSKVKRQWKEETKAKGVKPDSF